MRYDSRNLNIVRAHSFKTNTSRTRPQSALAAGICVSCSNDVVLNAPIVWDRRHGIFHASCYRSATMGTGATIVKEVGLDSESVQSMIDEAISSIEKPATIAKEIPVDATAILNAVRKILGETRAVTLDLKKLDGTVKSIKNVHETFRKLCYLVDKKKNVYLYGPPGSGKSTAAKMAADANDLTFGYISLNPQTPESRLLGFIDASGVYRPTVFRIMYEKGGVYCIDEMDNAAAMLLTTLNSCLENGLAAFPDGMVTRHENFIVVATGNTAGRGGNKQFPDRRAFDAAFAGRFAFVFWGYDEALERKVALQINGESLAWIGWVQSVRKWATDNDPQIVVSPRETYHIASALSDKVLTAAEIAEVFLFKGIEPARTRRIIDAFPFPQIA